MKYIITMFTTFFFFAQDTVAQVKTTDSTFIRNSRPIEFVVNRININEQDRKWITEVLIPELKALGDRGIVLGRATASPEGPLPNNQRLARERRASVDALLSSYGISTKRIRYDVVAEDYPLLRALMLLNHDTRLHEVDSLIKRFGGNTERLKAEMKRFDGGKLWRYVLKVYFPKLRAVRIMAIDERLVDIDNNGRLALPVKPVPMFIPLNTGLPMPEADIRVPYIELPVNMKRRELLSIKSNILLDFAYMPGYDRFCPIPNVAIEYYPLHGHFTYGASFDGPWWQHYDAHKYFQLRNYQLFTRYYLRSGDIAKCKPGEGAAFKGLFFNMYAHAFLYNICFGEKRGWEGEGWGTGLGIGYTLPLGKSEHWRLDFGIQAGFFNTRYDPYQWLCPIDPDNDQQLYYYKWYGDAKNFKKRQHSYSWFGPTRIDITLSYDLIYRKRTTK